MGIKGLERRMDLWKNQVTDWWVNYRPVSSYYWRSIRMTNPEILFEDFAARVKDQEKIDQSFHLLIRHEGNGAYYFPGDYLMHDSYVVVFRSPHQWVDN